MARPTRTALDRFFDQRSWSMLILAILLLLAFAITVPSLFVALERSGFLGDRVPPGGWTLVVSVAGLTILFSLYMIHQQAQLNRLRRQMMRDEMDLEQSRSRLAELTALFQLGNSLRLDLPLETILEITVRRVASTLHSHHVAIFLLDPGTKTLTCRASFGLSASPPEPDVPWGEGPLGWVARHGEPILMARSEGPARFAGFFSSHPHVGSVLFLPVAVDQRAVAVLQVSRAVKSDPFRMEHRDIGQLFAQNVAGVIDRAVLMMRLRQTTVPENRPESGSQPAIGAFRDSFLSAAARELGSPLTTILAYSEVLDQNDRRMTPAMRLEFTSRVRSEAQRLNALLSDVLDSVRVELGRYLLELDRVNLNELIRESAESARPIAKAKELDLELALDSKIPDQLLDASKLRYAIGSLLKNGIRFSPPKGQIRVTSWLGDESVQIEFRDAGPPIAPESAPLLFDLEHAADQGGPRAKDGLLFGLHLARRYVELHNGSIGAGPAPDGTGAMFWICVPRGEDVSRLIGSDPFVEEIAKG